MHFSQAIVLLTSVYIVSANPYVPQLVARAGAGANAVGRAVTGPADAGTNNANCLLVYPPWTVTVVCPPLTEILSVATVQGGVGKVNAAVPTGAPAPPAAPNSPSAAVPTVTAAPKAAAGAGAAAAGVNTCTTVSIHGPHTYSDVCANGQRAQPTR